MEKVKDELMRVGAVLKFHINKALIDSVKDSLSKYNADLEMKKSRKKKEGSRTITKMVNWWNWKKNLKLKTVSL